MADPTGGSPCRRPAVTHVLLLILAVAGSAAEAQRAELQSSLAESNEGYFQLTWQADTPVRLVESVRGDFTDARVLYEGSDTARVVSGKPDGRWFYRLEAIASDAPISDAVTVTVAHHPLRRALTFFGIGALVFLATLGLIVFGGRAVARDG